MGKPLKNIPTFGSRIELSDEVLAHQKKAFEDELKVQGKPEKSGIKSFLEKWKDLSLITP